MSEWRLKGFVQDSDEEEEDLEISPPHSCAHPDHALAERVEDPFAALADTREDKDVEERQDEIARDENNGDVVLIALNASAPAHPSASPTTSPGVHSSTLRPTTPPFHSSLQFARRSTKSPDPLQSGIFRENRRAKLPSSQILGLPASTPLPSLSNLEAAGAIPANEGLLTELGIAPLSDASDSELSDPPSDLDLSSPPRTVFASPKRRTTVQVVISRSSAVPQETFEWSAQRSFRERKPIQLHPYLLEGERYRQVLQGRGVKPVPREKSPAPKPGRCGNETQEQEFDPDNICPSSSPPEIPVSTPIARKSTAANHGSSIHRRGARSTRPGSTPSILHVASGAKRRRLDRPFTRIPSVLRHTTSSREETSRDIWDVPQSPPYSSSPAVNGARSIPRKPIMPGATAHVLDLPTPTYSPDVEEYAYQRQDSDSEVPSRNVNLSAAQRRRTVTILDDSSSDPGSSNSESEAIDMELRRVGKRIKGVLPASWLRLDRKAQEKRKERTMERAISHQSPGKGELHRGVAQRVINQRSILRRTDQSSTPREDFILISDESDDHSGISTHRAMDAQRSAEAACDIAANLDRRYAEEDSDNMEYDRLQLFTLGGPERKRKRQSRLTDGFVNIKKHKTRAKRAPPPALSVLDFDDLPSNKDVPQFLRVAKRRASRRQDHARQSPSNKFLRLHTAHDTADANATLENWKHGILRQKTTDERSKRETTDREPLTNIDHNLPRQRLPDALKDPGVGIQDRSLPTSRMRQKRKRRDIPPGLLIFQRALNPSKTGSSHPGTRGSHRTHKQPTSYRTAQLEGLETDFGHGDRKSAFQRGLQQVDRQFRLQIPFVEPSKNPQLARFLVDGGTTPGFLPPEEEEQTRPSTETTLVPKPRLRRKVRAKRIDANAREYRQPSEPTAQTVAEDPPSVNNSKPEQSLDQAKTGLQGLGPYGTRYPTTFDVSPLEDGTYFHSSTFIGGDELRRALETGKTDRRDLDSPAGYCVISYHATSIKCGPWNDETFSLITNLMHSIWSTLDDILEPGEEEKEKLRDNAFRNSANVLRSLINYFSTHLNFLDAVDRQTFASRMIQFVKSMLSQFQSAALSKFDQTEALELRLECIRAMTYLLVATMQVNQIARHPIVDSSIPLELANLMTSVSLIIIRQLVRRVSQLGNFLEQNKLFQVREKGIQDSDIVVETLVVCMHVLTVANVPRSSFWELVSQTLSPQAEKASHLGHFEKIWEALFTLLPFIELDISGILIMGRRASFEYDNWNCIRHLLKRLFSLYSGMDTRYTPSLNDYIRASLSRCHVLIHFWHWRRCESILSTLFDFFGKHGLRQLRHEESHRSAHFIESLAEGPSLNLAPSDSAFHIFLKCLALGLKDIGRTYPEKKIRSLVFRLTPNHGRSYPKDQPLDSESLNALRNHHDLLCTLYWASPAACRPKLDLVSGLVHHEHSHREACRLNVRAWANLTAFQLSTNDAYPLARPFAEWHQSIMDQTLEQYRLAKTEAENYIKSGVLDDSDALSLMVRQTMEKNQEQVIATLRDCIAGMHRAIKVSSSQASLREFVVDSGIVQLLELPHFEDSRLVIVIRDVLRVLRVYTTQRVQSAVQETSQQPSEESQDYGQFPDIDDLDGLEEMGAAVQSGQTQLDFIQLPLWHLLSNAFGAENSPDDNLLMDCIETWALVAGRQVSSGARLWSYYLNAHSQVSWQQLRRTEQTQKFGPYFFAAFLSCNPEAYAGHETTFITTLLLCLVDRESNLRFQHRLLHAIMCIDHKHPLLRNIPFAQDQSTGEFDITADALRARRLALISTILANMRDHFHTTIRDEPDETMQVKQDYAAMLKDFMTMMKSNYQQLRQGTTATGAYVEFVQKIVQFLQQYTTDICPVLDFFTNSVAFPLPADDPTYVVGRLRGYAPKLSRAGVAKQLAIFIQTVAQQSAADNQQAYLVNQLATALCSDGGPSRDRTTLRSTLLQGILPAYIEAAFSSNIGFLIAKPILESLRSILQANLFGMRVFDEASVRSLLNTILSVSHAFIRSTEQLKGNAMALVDTHMLQATALMFKAMVPNLSLLDYIYGRWLGSTSRPIIVTYLEQLGEFVLEMLDGRGPDRIPSYSGDAHAFHGSHADLHTFCTDSLRTSIETNWSEASGSIFFGQGYARREVVVVDVGTIEEEKARLVGAIEAFHAAVAAVYGNNRDGGNVSKAGSFLGEVNI